MQNLIATTFEVVHYIALQAVHYKPLQEVHLSRYNHIPLGVPPILRLFGWMIGLAIVIPLCFLPDLFCKLRYTAGRREALREHYGKMKHPGRKLAKIVLIAIALIVANVALMFHLGFIHWA